MSDYISREAAIKTHCSCCAWQGNVEPPCDTCKEPANFWSIPAADVRPVVRGEWRIIDIKNTKNGPVRSCVCSECCFGATFINAPNYCPNCGADMRGDQMIAATETEGEDAEN